MKISIRLDSASIKAAAARVEDYAAELDRLAAEACERVARVGEDAMREVYAAAEYAGVNDVVLAVEGGDGKAILSATGSTVGFIEFGTGVNYPLGEAAAKAGAPAHGTYGKGKGATGDPWIYAGEQGTSGTPVKGREGVYWTDGNPPANAFPAAMMAMENAAEEIVSEVFKP